MAGETGHADLQVLLGRYVQRGEDTPEQAPETRIADNPALEKLFRTLDDESRALLLHALIGTSGTQYKNI